MAAVIRGADTRVCYVAPGIQVNVANAILESAKRSPNIELTVSVDFDERVMRMGYGHIEGVRVLRDAEIEVRHSPGFRSAVLIADDSGWVFTPTALYLEGEPQSEETPNALSLSGQQLEEILLRLSPAAKAKAIAAAPTEAERAYLRKIPDDIGIQAIAPRLFDEVDENLKQAPPVEFDIIKQVRVFEPYLQYVELTLSGAAIQRHRLPIPKSIQKLGSVKELENRLRTTFDLIEKGSKLSSKPLEDELNEIRRNFTRSFGKEHGRIMLKAVKPHLKTKLESLGKHVAKHQRTIAKQLQKKLDKSRKQIVGYYLSRAMQNPPDALLGQSLAGKPSREDARSWLERELEPVFPNAETLIQKIVLDERYKDVTFETLNAPDFLSAVKTAFPAIDWDKTYAEFKAAGEKQKQQSGSSK
jgi:hypothetical protein